MGLNIIEDVLGYLHCDLGHKSSQQSELERNLTRRLPVAWPKEYSGLINSFSWQQMRCRLQGSSFRIHIHFALDGIRGCIRQNPQSLCLHEVQSCRNDQYMQGTAQVIALQTGEEVSLH